MNFLTIAAAAACVAGFSFTSSPAAPAPLLYDCHYVQSSQQVQGGCMQWASGDCAPCCRHEDLAMEVPICAAGNQYEACINYNHYFQAMVRYCPGTPPNDCTYCCTLTCSQYAIAGVVNAICPIPP